MRLMCPRREASLFIWGLCCELYVGVKGIKVGEELLGVFCLVDDKGVIHIPQQILRGLGAVLNAQALKSSMNRLATKWLL